MAIILRVFQFLPLTVFLYFSRQNIESGEANWGPAFEAGALAAGLELMILIPLLKTKISRLITAVNLYLIIGGLAFYFNFIKILNLIGALRETGLFIVVVLTVLIATIITPTGVFESAPESSDDARRFSFYFLGWSAIVATFSWSYKGSIQWAGVLPFVSLIAVKYFLEKRVLKNYIHKKKN